MKEELNKTVHQFERERLKTANLEGLVTSLQEEVKALRTRSQVLTKDVERWVDLKYMYIIYAYSMIYLKKSHQI